MFFRFDVYAFYNMRNTQFCKWIINTVTNTTAFVCFDEKQQEKIQGNVSKTKWSRYNFRIFCFEFNNFCTINKQITICSIVIQAQIIFFVIFSKIN